MQYISRIEKWIRYILAVLLCLVLISFWMMSNLFAKYATEASGQDGARVALFGQSETIDVKQLTKDMVPGDSSSYKLKVTNQTGSEVSEVAQTYEIEVQTAGNLPLTYTLKNSDGTTIGTFSESEAKSSTFSNADMKFEAKKAKAHEYTLEVKWPEEEKSAELQGIPDFTKITIKVMQTD